LLQRPEMVYAMPRKVVDRRGIKYIYIYIYIYICQILCKIWERLVKWPKVYTLCFVFCLL